MVLLLGATDTGKSTLAQFLISHLCQRGLMVALVDADIGQSSISLSSICFVLFEKPYFIPLPIFKVLMFPAAKNR